MLLSSSFFQTTSLLLFRFVLSIFLNSAGITRPLMQWKKRRREELVCRLSSWEMLTHAVLMTNASLHILCSPGLSLLGERPSYFFPYLHISSLIFISSEVHNGSYRMDVLIYRSSARLLPTQPLSTSASWRTTFYPSPFHFPDQSTCYSSSPSVTW